MTISLLCFISSSYIYSMPNNLISTPNIKTKQVCFEGQKHHHITKEAHKSQSKEKKKK